MILEKIDPTKIKNLSDAERETLCEEIRNTIISTVQTNGGHLSSNLGIVELTVGLFCAFDFSKDKVVWDVGHQCYPFKLLTGRYDRFSSLRKRGGISGFPKRTESEYDVYDTGHAGNSVSVAIGLAKAYELKGEDRTVIAVIGDGSFANGLIYEALNSLSALRTKILIVLNDNEMSISPTVGKLHEMLSERDEGEKEKNISFFEQFGLKYIEEKDGNDLSGVMRALDRAKEELQRSAVLLHIHTKKGRGYEFCEENPTETHGVAPSNTEKEEEYSHILGETLCEEAEKNPSVCAVTAAMTDALGLRNFFTRFPERSFDVGICEENAAVLCAGLACGGMKPYFAIYSTFLQRSFDELIHDISAQDLPVTFCVDRGGISGADGETHQGVFDLSYLSLIPNLIVASPKDGVEFRNLLRLSANYPHPIAIRYPRSAKANYGSREGEEIRIGSFEYLSGDPQKKVTVLACGERAVTIAFKVKEKTGKDFAIVNARFVKPLDKDLLSAIRSEEIITIEDNVKNGGFGEKISDFYQNSGKKLHIFAYTDRFIPHGGVEELQSEFGVNPEEIASLIGEIYES